MIVELSKAEVIDAIRKASIYDVFFDNDTSTAKLSECSACAAGEVLKAALHLNTPKDEAMQQMGLIVRGGRYFSGSAMDELDAQRWINAISVTFEMACEHASNDVLETGRNAAIEMVKEHFPPTITIDIGDLEPREGIKGL